MSGLAVFDAGNELLKNLKGRLRFDFLSSTNDGNAYSGSFTRELVALLEQGLDTGTEHLTCGQVFGPLAKILGRQQLPLHLTFGADAGLYLSRNADHDLPWVGTLYGENVRYLTRSFQPTSALKELADNAAKHRLIAVRGPKGSGKSTHVAALARPTVTGGIIAARFVDAVIFLNGSRMYYEIFEELKEQLTRSLGKAFKEDLSKRQNACSAEEALAATVKAFSQERDLVLIYDAIDELEPLACNKLFTLLATLSEIQSLKIIVTTWRTASIPSGFAVYEMPSAHEHEIGAYVSASGLDIIWQNLITKRAAGSWLVADLIVRAAKNGASPSGIPGW